MTRKELLEVKQEYKRQILAMRESQKHEPTWVAMFCLDLATEMCYNHHERGQRLWAFSQAFYEVVGEYA